MTEMMIAERARAARPWVVPPGLASQQEPFDGFLVLEEVRSELGVTLWQYLRDIDLWSATAPEARSRLFAPGVGRRRRDRLATLGAAAELHEPLESIGRALDGRARLPAAQLTEACRLVAGWASGQGLPQTALAFARSAALAVPDAPAAAFQVGQLARRGGEPRRAETWFRRALALARRGGDWHHYGLACLALAALQRGRGECAPARAWCVRALRVARRRALAEVRPLALQEMFAVVCGNGDRDDADIWARRAFRAYGAGHPRLAQLAREVAGHWLASGHHAEALRVWRALLPHLRRLPERRQAAAAAARAAAGAGDRLTYAAMWSETWRLVDEYDDGEGVAEALLSLAAGAIALADSDRGQLAAAHALKLASQRGEGALRAAAEQALLALRAPLPPPRAAPRVLVSVASARREFADRLARALGPGALPEVLE